MLRLSAFRLWPIFFLRLALLFFVTLVRETILQILDRKMLNSRKIYLSIILLFVKIFQPSFAAQLETKTIIMSKGEHKSFNLLKLNKYSVGNKEVLNILYRDKLSQLIIKAKRTGYSELVLWPPKGPSVLWKIYVLSKTKHLAMASLSEQLSQLGLRVDLLSSMIQVEGEISSRQVLSIVNKLMNKHSKKILLKVTLNPKLKQQILKDIYQQFYNHYIDSITCQYHELHFNCQYQNQQTPPVKLIKQLTERFPVNFNAVSIQYPYQLFAKVKLIQLEKVSGKTIDIGLEEIESNLNNFFQLKFEHLLQSNRALLQKNQLKMSTLAQTEILLTSNHPAELRFGQEIPYPIRTDQGPELQWKFSGLKLSLTARPVLDLYQVDYCVEMGGPQEGQETLKGSRQKSRVNLRLNRPIKLFSLNLKSIENSRASTPLMGDIPLLKKFFNSTQKSFGNKRVYALLRLERRAL